jgi:hypothetical protein
VTKEVDADLYELEPDDIHLEFDIPASVHIESTGT